MDDPDGMVSRIRFALDDRIVARPFSGDNADQVGKNNHQSNGCGNEKSNKKDSTNSEQKESAGNKQNSDDENLGETCKHEEKLSANDAVKNEDEEEEDKSTDRNAVKG